MQEKPKPDEPSIASVERDLFGCLFDFYTKAIKLLRTAHLEDDKREVVSKRINQLLDEVKAEVGKPNGRLNMPAQLEAAHEDVKQLVEKLTASSDVE